MVLMNGCAHVALFLHPLSFFSTKSLNNRERLINGYGWLTALLRHICTHLWYHIIPPNVRNNPSLVVQFVRYFFDPLLTFSPHHDIVDGGSDGLK